jgi:hypothetical protein
VLPIHHASRAALIGVAVGAAAVAGLGMTTVASTFGIGGSHHRAAVAAAPGSGGSGSVELREHPASRPANTKVTPARLTPLQASVVHRPAVAKPKPVVDDLLPDVPAVLPPVPSTPSVPTVPVEPAGPPAPQSLVQQLVQVLDATLSAIQL